MLVSYFSTILFRILVTHQLQYLRSVDKVYVMKDGQIQESGTFDDLMQLQVCQHQDTKQKLFISNASIQ